MVLNKLKLPSVESRANTTQAPLASWEITQPLRAAQRPMLPLWERRCGGPTCPAIKGEALARRR